MTPPRRPAMVATAVAMLVAAGLATRMVAVPAAEPERPRTLRVAAMPIAAALDWSASRPEGPMVDVWDELAARLGVTTDFVRVDGFARMLAAVGDGTADVALGPVAITESRERTMDFTHPIFHSGMRIAVRQRPQTGFGSALAAFVSWRLLTLVGLVVAAAVVSGHLLWWCERRINPRSFPPAYPWGVCEAVWWVASTIVTGGCDNKHVESGLGRALAFAWMVGGIVLLAAFTSVLTATLTAERVAGTIRGPRDLAGRAVGCQTAAAAAIQAVRQRGGIVQEFPTVQDALEALDLGLVEAVVSENQQLMHLITQRGRGDCRLVGPVFESFDYGFGLPTGSDLREPLNAAILTMREDGTFTRIVHRWLGAHD